MSKTPRKTVCIEKCVEQNKEAIAALKGTKVWSEEVYSRSFTGNMCRAKCDTYKNSREFEKCEKKEWRKCRGSLKDCDEFIEKKCDNTISARISKALFYP
ncbi:hypothetical protein ISTM_234 [Insectomime virus]|uniref:Uncharacterized protein n=1 Tax=Tunisvirus fontaine2 TaxID=1421067 RepID=V9SGB3_9VIRU|nr:hypothetical protein D1R32_gp080 [Tunisvirus fontaine2]AHA46132.1 hypothetical protein ISTM_234 [Insectomime virus]AHC54797.1 hypothetical protein TNS_ORF79 [Tunisvirus fontaine2]